MASLKIKRDDQVVVIAGRERGKTGRVLRVLPRDGRVVVEGLNIVKRHVKRQGEEAGRIVEKEAPIHISNVALWDAAEGRRIKVGFAVDEQGRKVRIDKKTQAPIQGE